MSPAWRLERRVPLTLLVVAMLHLGGGLIWAAQLDARVGGIERQAVSTEGLNEKFARMDERLEHMKQDIGGMRYQLDKLTERLLK